MNRSSHMPKFTIRATSISTGIERRIRGNQKICGEITLQLTIIPRVTLAGRVVGPGGVPLAAMRVEVLGTPLKTETDAQGRFTVAGVPEADEVRLRLVGRGRVLTAQVDPTDADLVIKCDLPVR